MKAFGKVNFIEVNRQILTPNDRSVRLFLVKRLRFSLRIIRFFLLLLLLLLLLLSWRGSP